MKIAVIGTSNSVMKGGYVGALRASHDVTNFSSGRVPYYAHVKTLLKNEEQLRQFDLIILDHYINDVNYYVSRMPDSYAERLVDFYALLARLKVPVLNIVFPIVNLSLSKSYWYYEKVKHLSERFDFFTLDLNLVLFEPSMYKDSIHLKKEVSYYFGCWLAGEICFIKWSIPKGIKSREGVFSLLGEEYLRLQSGVEEYSFSNSLMELNCFLLKETLTLPNSGEIVSFGYFNSKESESLHGFTVNGTPYALFGSLYYHEALSSSGGEVILEPLFGLNDGVPYLHGRGAFKGTVSGYFDYPTVTEFLFHDGSHPGEELPSGQGFLIDLSKFASDVAHIFSFSAISIPAETIDYLRDLAIANERSDLECSYKLMTVAATFRPGGVGIQKKLAQYKTNLRG
ncbi:hypothetical protein ACQUQU_09650 [Thalassolituus sp. LLYu03]|uniref:hypothetical protein n=1 Tax=Thalassolituus sp. LLYu03 TaxID=3421656 RepID=UPI003D2E05B2